MVDLYKNPNMPVDNWGAVMKPYDTDSDLLRLSERGAHMVTVDSRNRNRTRFPNANNFRIQFQQPYKGIYSVELLSAIIPIPEAAAITERYVAIRSRELQTCEPGQATNAAQNAFGVDSPYYSPNLDLSFAQIPLIPNFPLAYTGGNAAGAVPPVLQATHWKKSEARVVKRFYPFKAELRYIDIELILRNNTNGEIPYPFTNEAANPATPTAPENNIVLQFEIVAKT